MLNRILSLVIRELLTIWRDPKTRSFLFIPPIADMLIFTFAATLEVKNVPIGVWNEDRGVISRDLAARLEGSPNFARVVYFDGHKNTARAMDLREVLMVVHIGPDFSRSVASGQPAKVITAGRPQICNTAQIVAGYGGEIVTRYEQELDHHGRSSEPPSVVVMRAWFVPDLQATWSYRTGTARRPEHRTRHGYTFTIGCPRARAGKF